MSEEADLEYTVSYVKGEDNRSAFEPDVPGCVAAAETIEELEELFAETLRFHIEGLLEDGEELPQPTCVAGTVPV